MPDQSLSFFHAVVQQWFSETLGDPTDIQRETWPELARGKHVLVTAPTGSGKTLAAFLWGLNQLITGAWPRGRVRVLYVSPLILRSSKAHWEARYCYRGPSAAGPARTAVLTAHVEVLGYK